MTIEERLLKRIESLVNQGDRLYEISKDSRDPDYYSACQETVGWIAAARHAVSLICSPEHVYSSAITGAQSTYADNPQFFGHPVGAIKGVLTHLLEDAKAGLLSTVANTARAEVFDDFLDHAKHYYRDGKKNEAGTIAGVVFEDTIRRLSDKQGITQKGVPLDRLISELASKGLLTSTKAKRARTAAHVRTKATHAQWEEFELGDVDETIRVTTELVELLEA